MKNIQLKDKYCKDTESLNPVVNANTKKNFFSRKSLNREQCQRKLTHFIPGQFPPSNQLIY